MHRPPDRPHARKRRVLRSRLRLELLDQRQLLAANVFEQIADDITHPSSGLLASVRDQIESAPEQAMPLIGSPMSAIAELLDEARHALDTAIAEMANAKTPTDAQVASTIASTLMASELLGDRDGNGVLNGDDVDVQLGPDLDSVDIQLDISRDVTTASADALAFHVGLPSLPFYTINAPNNVEASFGIEYVGLNFGFENGQAFLKLDQPGNELTVSVNAGLSEDFALEGAMGVIHGAITQAAGPTELVAEIGVDLAGGNPTFEFAGHAEVNLQLNADIISAGNASFPGVAAVLHVGFDDFSAPPVVEFQDIRLEFESGFFQPIVETLEPILDVAGWIVDKLNADIPVLSELTQAVTGESVSVMSIVETVANWDVLSPEYDAIVEGAVTAANIIDILDQLETGDDQLVQFNFGDFAIAGDPRNAPHAGDITDWSDASSALSELEIDPNSFDPAAFGFDAIEAQIDQLPDELNALKEGLGNLFDQLENGVQMSTPLFTNPGEGIFKLLLGQDVDLFQLESHFNPVGDFGASFELPIGIDAGLEGVVEPEFDMVFGYDTFGLRTMLHDLYTGDPVNTSDLLSGLYFGEETQFRLAAGIEAFLGFNAIVFHADVTGGIIGEFEIAVPSDANPDDDGKVRIRTEDGLNNCLFEIAGSVDASLSATAQFGVHIPVVGFVGIEKKHVIASQELIGFDFSCVANPWSASKDPQLATLHDDGTLELNVGLQSVHRGHNPGETDEVYYLNSVEDENGLGIQVMFDGKTERHYGVTSIVGDFANGDDAATIDLSMHGDSLPLNIVFLDAGSGANAMSVVAPSAQVIQLLGGAQGDQLAATGGELTLIFGGGGDDHLSVTDAVVASIAGEQGQDTIAYLGSGSATLFGGAGDDTLTGGDGVNQLDGGDGNDILVGGGGSNVLHGGSHDDVLIAGPNGDMLDGGDGSDQFQAGAGDDTISTGEGVQEHIAWSYGDGNTLILAPGGGYQNNVVLEMLGSEQEDYFEVEDGPFLTIQAPLGKVIEARNVDELNIDAQGAEDHVLINALRPELGVKRISVNVTQGLVDDGAVDRVEVLGDDNDNELVVEQVQAILEAFDPVLFQSQHELLTWGGVTKVSGMPDYDVYVMNTHDDLRIHTFQGDDTLQIKSITGPTIVDTGSDDDAIDVSAATAGVPGLVIPMVGPIPPDFPTELQIEAGSGKNRLTIDEVAYTQADSFQITNALVTSALFPGVHYQATGGHFTEFAVIGTAQADTFFVRSTAANAEDTIVHTWHGNDTIHVGNAERLDEIASQLTLLVGSSGSATAILYDVGATHGNSNVQFKGSTITGLAGASDSEVIRVDSWGGELLVELHASDDASVAESFTIDGFLAPISLRGGRGLEAFFVESLAATAILDGEEGADLYQIGDQLSQIDATLSIEDAQGENQIVVDDTGSPGQIYRLDATGLDLPATSHAEINLANASGALTMLASFAGSQFQALGRPLGLSVDVDLGSDHQNVLIGPDTDVEWRIQAENQVQIQSIGSFAGAHHLIGGDGDDRFVFEPLGQLSGHVIGSQGADLLDYSKRTTAVHVDLASSSATSVGGLVVHVENVWGGDGDDVLLGNDEANQLRGNDGDDVLVGQAGKDQLIGDDGRDILIGGAGSDSLQGGSDDDLLIGGTTAHDASVTALTEILNEWTRPDASYGLRLKHLRHGGGLNGATVLDAATVADDLTMDRLRGGKGRDWFWASAVDMVYAEKDEEFN